MKVWKSELDLFIYLYIDLFLLIHISDEHKAAYFLFDDKSFNPETKYWTLCEARVHNHSPLLRRNVVISTFMFIAVHTLVIIYIKWVPLNLEWDKNLSEK